jgi:hypothetical protein
VHRGLITPLTSQYHAATVDIGIPLGGIMPNLIFSSAMALHISVISYSHEYLSDARFIVGIIFFVAGYFMNRYSDWYVKELRVNKGTSSANDEKRDLISAEKPATPAVVVDSSSAPAAAASPSTPQVQVVVIDGVAWSGKYALPNSVFHRWCYCPQYFGEFILWAAYAVLTSSLVGVLFALFGLSTFLPRALSTKKWYLEKFPGHAPPERAAFFPFLL